LPPLGNLKFAAKRRLLNSNDGPALLCICCSLAIGQPFLKNNQKGSWALHKQSYAHKAILLSDFWASFAKTFPGSKLRLKVKDNADALGCFEKVKRRSSGHDRDALYDDAEDGDAAYDDQEDDCAEGSSSSSSDALSVLQQHAEVRENCDGNAFMCLSCSFAIGKPILITGRVPYTQRRSS
jgi:hypothetical protein